jgi:hypothetical protein
LRDEDTGPNPSPWNRNPRRLLHVWQLESAPVQPYLQRAVELLVRQLRESARGGDVNAVDASMTLACRLTHHLAWVTCSASGDAGSPAVTAAILQLAAQAAPVSTEALTALATALRIELGAGLDTAVRPYHAACHALVLVASLLDQCERCGWMAQVVAVGAVQWFRLQHQVAAGGSARVGGMAAEACTRLSARLLRTLQAHQSEPGVNLHMPHAAAALLHPLLSPLPPHPPPP